MVSNRMHWKMNFIVKWRGFLMYDMDIINSTFINTSKPLFYVQMPLKFFELVDWLDSLYGLFQFIMVHYCCRDYSSHSFSPCSCGDCLTELINEQIDTND